MVISAESWGSLLWIYSRGRVGDVCVYIPKVEFYRDGSSPEASLQTTCGMKRGTMYSEPLDGSNSQSEYLYISGIVVYRIHAHMTQEIQILFITIYQHSFKCRMNNHSFAMSKC